MSGAPVRVEKREGHVALITLDRPEKLNALNAEVRALLKETFASLAADDDVRAVVLCGAGEKAFIAGADVTEFAARTAEEQRAVYAEPRVYEVVADFPKPVLAAIHGFCIGGGSELALACDVRVADRTARISQAEIRIGLVDVLVDEGKHVDRALELAGRMARWSPVALRLGKEAIRAAFELPLAEGLEHEKELFLRAFASEDGREGVRAFVEKRKPDFKGR